MEHFEEPEPAYTTVATVLHVGSYEIVIIKQKGYKDAVIDVKELAMKKDALDGEKAKPALVEKEGSVDQQALDKKKEILKEQYANVDEVIRKVEMKLKSLQQ